MTHDLIGYSGNLRNDNHSHLQLASLTMHHIDKLTHCNSTNMVRFKTRHIERSASRQGGDEGELPNCAMRLCACESGGAI